VIREEICLRKVDTRRFDHSTIARWLRLTLLTMTFLAATSAVFSLQASPDLTARRTGAGVAGGLDGSGVLSTPLCEATWRSGHARRFREPLQDISARSGHNLAVRYRFDAR
jgi:hypothetical protein